jgi:hypothetical protein
MRAKATKVKLIRVRVTAKDIREGGAGDCFRCAVAGALQRATGDNDAHVYESDFLVYLTAWSRHIHAPDRVRTFVLDYDECPVHERTGRLPADLRPFVFTLPPQDDPEWLERCGGCEQLFAGSELDDEGICPECMVTD